MDQLNKSLLGGLFYRAVVFIVCVLLFIGCAFAVSPDYVVLDGELSSDYITDDFLVSSVQGSSPVYNVRISSYNYFYSYQRGSKPLESNSIQKSSAVAMWEGNNFIVNTSYVNAPSDSSFFSGDGKNSSVLGFNFLDLDISSDCIISGSFSSYLTSRTANSFGVAPLKPVSVDVLVNGDPIKYSDHTKKVPISIDGSSITFSEPLVISHLDYPSISSVGFLIYFSSGPALAIAKVPKDAKIYGSFYVQPFGLSITSYSPFDFFFDSVSSLVAGSVGWFGSYVTAITGQPLLLAFVVISFVGFGVGLIKRFKL